MTRHRPRPNYSAKDDDLHVYVSERSTHAQCVTATITSRLLNRAIELAREGRFQMSTLRPITDSISDDVYDKGFNLETRGSITGFTIDQ
jgi:hypothetical protein